MRIDESIETTAVAAAVRQRKGWRRKKEKGVGWVSTAAVVVSTTSHLVCVETRRRALSNNKFAEG